MVKLSRQCPLARMYTMSIARAEDFAPHGMSDTPLLLRAEH